MNAERLSRRTVLKGLGVSMCLPLLEAMGPLVASGETRGPSEPRSRGKAPLRLAVLYMPNGVHPQEWASKGKGKEFQLSSVLAPLAPLQSEILVLGELMNKHSIPGDGHYVKVAPFLTGTSITKTTGSNVRVGGVSLDQVVAQHLGNLTPLPSLELSVEPVTMGVDTNVGFTRLYGSHISWSSTTTPVTRELNPKLAFDRVFRSPGSAGHSGSGVDPSVLDAVMADAKRLKTRLGQADRDKLDEYFEAVGSVEKRIAFDAARRAGEHDGDPVARKEIERLGKRIDLYQDPANMAKRGIDHTEQVRLMLDIMVLAFWTDTTRVATFMFGNEVSGRNFSFLPGVSGSHHEISHHQNEKDKLEQYRRINIWHMEQYAYMIGKMKAIREGEGTLLDHSMVLFGAGMRDGNAHSPYNLPIVLAGRGGGTLATGRSLVYPKQTALCNLYRSMLDRIGVPLSHFGDSTELLPGLDDPNFVGT